MNKLSVNQIDIDYDRPINNRAKLDTGKLCNYKCEFCYYKDHLMERDTLQQIKDRIDSMVRYGITEVDLSGGESSVEPNWFNILEYCEGKFERISCLSHGGKFSDIDFMRMSHQYGLREILFSLHGFSAEEHDQIVGKKGAFNNLINAIDNAHKVGIEVRINTTLYMNNYDKVRTNLIKMLRPTQMNFIALNYWRDNANGDPIDYDKICEKLRYYIRQLREYMEVNARYFPMCYMEGYEDHVKNHYHHIYDMKDWNKPLYNEGLDTSVQYTHHEKVDQAFAEADRLRLFSCFKTAECAKCKYFIVCDGIEKPLRGKVFPIAVEGPLIKRL